MMMHLRLMERNSAPVRLRKSMHDSQPIATHGRFWIYQTGYSRIPKLSTVYRGDLLSLRLQIGTLPCCFFQNIVSPTFSETSTWNSKDLRNGELTCPHDIIITRTSVETPSSSSSWKNIFYFHPENWRNDSIWRAYFSDGLVQPPTRVSSAPFFIGGLEPGEGFICCWRGRFLSNGL